MLLVVLLIWSRLCRRRRRLARTWFLSFVASVLSFDRAGRLLPVSLQRVSDWWEDDVMTMGEYQFRNHFRLKRSVFNQLVDDLNMPRAPNGIKREKMVGIALYRLASGLTLRDISNLCSVSTSTVNKCTKIVVHYINTRLGNRITWPTTERELRKCAQTFLKFGSVYGCIGAVDGSLINLKKNPGDESWYDRHGNYSINTLAICDGNTRFLEVFTGCQGSFNDQRVMRLSRVPSLGQALPRGYFIIGDGGYQLEPWCLIPYKSQVSAQSRNKSRYNGWLSRSRVKIEHAFGSLKGRWKILQGIDMKIPLAVRTIIACCILHNYCLDNNDEWIIDQQLPSVPPAHLPLPAGWLPVPRRSAQMRADADAVRRSVVNQLSLNALNMNG